MPSSTVAPLLPPAEPASRESAACAAATLYRIPSAQALREDADGYRHRRFIRLGDRPFGFAADFLILERSVQRFLAEQQEDGCFMPPEILELPDKSDDQLGAACMLAYYLELKGAGATPGEVERLERAVRFHLDRLVFRARNSCRYLRTVLAHESPYDWCATLWALLGATKVLEHGAPFLRPETRDELEDLAADYWKFVRNNPLREENPCHNQILEYCGIGYSYAKRLGRQDLQREILDYYRTVVRGLRFWHRGRLVFGEHNSWCSEYTLLSWFALEKLALESGETMFDEDALEMAAAFNDHISAGGYAYGGIRRDEGSYEQFLFLFWRRAKQFGFERLLLPEPSDAWESLVFDGHLGRIFVTRMPLYAYGQAEAGPEERLASAYVGRKGRVSVHLGERGRARLISVNGLEILQANEAAGEGDALVYRAGGRWWADPLLVNPPPPSRGLRHVRTQRTELESGLAVLHAMQRGINLELRQWWIADGAALVWVIQVVAHGAVGLEGMRMTLGNPYLGEENGRVGPLAVVRSDDGIARAYGGAQTLESPGRFYLGNQCLAATHKVRFERPDPGAFNGFPTADGRLWREQASSNRLVLEIIDRPVTLDCRESRFAGVQIAAHAAMPEVSTGRGAWQCRFALGTFSASLGDDGRWVYRFRRGSVDCALPESRFAFGRAEEMNGTMNHPACV